MSKNDSIEPEESATHSPQGPGARLRAERENQGLRVESVAEALGLSTPVIAALEDDRYEALGAPVYIRGYLRKYAQFLGLSGDELVDAYGQASNPQEPELKSSLSSDAEHSGHRRRHWVTTLVTLVVVAIIVVVALWAWRYLRRGQERVQVPPSAAASAAPAFERSGFPALAPTATSTQAAVTATGRSQPAVSTHSESTGLALVTAPALPGTGSIGASGVSSAAPAAVAANALVLHIKSTSWVEVMAADHTRLYYDLASAGATLTFHGRHGALTVSLGNAPGVEVMVDGKPFTIPASSRSGNTARFKVDLKKTPSASTQS